MFCKLFNNSFKKDNIRKQKRNIILRLHRRWTLSYIKERPLDKRLKINTTTVKRNLNIDYSLSKKLKKIYNV